MSRRILLADDSVTIQKVIELTFMDDDYEVRAVGNGDEALAMLTALEVDFVIADVHMPGASGYEVCRQSKQLHPEVPVLLLVGTFEPFDEAQARASGADAFLKKPFDSQELLGRVHDLLAARAAPTPISASDLPASSPEPAADPAASASAPVGAEPVELPSESWPVFELEAEPEPEPEPPAVFPPQPPPPPPLPPLVAEPFPPFRPAPERAVPPEPHAAGDHQPFTLGETLEERAFILDESLAAPPFFQPPPPAPPAQQAPAWPEARRVPGGPGAATQRAEEVPAPVPAAAAAPATQADNAPKREERPSGGAPLATGRLENVESEQQIALQAAGHGQPAANGSRLSDSEVDRIARRVVELVGERVVRDVAWEVIPDLAEVVIKDRLRELESQIE
ncbi:MAG TPA: response regulator [Thermoanaerobaculia bacterium]|nr:response regulator [Thermoanaerobaculia bacterium]